MRLTPRVAGFRSEHPAGFKWECMAGFGGTRSHDRNQSVSPNFNGISIRQFSGPPVYHRRAFSWGVEAAHSGAITRAHGALNRMTDFRYCAGAFRTLASSP